MKKIATIYLVHGVLGKCGSLDAFIGFAPANVLRQCSFADILNEDTGKGYQRPFNPTHSRSFHQYIRQPGTATIPLTFNLRAELSKHWKIASDTNGVSVLELDILHPCLAQVDCQHRLGDMSESLIPLAFMTFIGLDLRTEMALFTVINSKAKGLSSSLTDFHQTNLLEDLAKEAPHLLLARRLNEDPTSPWFKMVRYGGETNSGLMRRTSFRMLQSSLKKVIKCLSEAGVKSIEEQYKIVVAYWTSVKKLFSTEWENHRTNLLTKGIGLYSLMELLCDFIPTKNCGNLTENFFEGKLTSLKEPIDWSSSGMFSKAGGKKGAHEVYQTLRKYIEL